MVITALFLGLAVFMMLGVPIGISIGLAALMAILVGDMLSMIFIPQALVTGVDSFPIMAIPMFILAGELMSSGGISKRILNVCQEFVGRFAGGLAMVAVMTALFFSSVSGSAPATVAAVGSMLIPTMLEKGYSKRFTLGLLATAGCMGVILPPSIPMVLYGVATGSSISAMFMAGFFPGMMVAVGLCVYVYLYSKKMGWKGEEGGINWPRARTAVWDAKWAFINPIIILGGIYGGFFTPTEAASVAAVYAFICGVFIYRELNMKGLYQSLAKAFLTTGTVMIVLGAATAFARILTIEQIPIIIANWMTGLTDSRLLILLYINIFMLIVGLVIDPTPAMLILSPILLPVAASFGVHPIHFGIIMVINLSIGKITPPIGINLFVASRVGNEKLEEVSRGVLPFVAVMLVILLLVTLIPQLSLFLPQLLL
ncbi:MAG: TRAP transporter large permease [Defluviitaleaceae bacterium]|nr:TRAP transporter large permease [Defluviitaleaceae bacterium]